MARFSTWLDRKGSCDKLLVGMLLTVIMVFFVLPDILMPMPAIPDGMPQPAPIAFASNFWRMLLLAIVVFFAFCWVAAAIQSRIDIRKENKRYAHLMREEPVVVIARSAAVVDDATDVLPFMVPAE